MSVRSVKHWAGTWVCASALVFLGGCATGPSANPKDPLEPMNRSISHFNDVLDDSVLRPAATGYRNGVPQPIQTGVRNFFNNLSDVWSTVNNGLQLEGRNTAESCMRVVVNTVFGIYGVFDVATAIGLQRHPRDFGETLAVWGVPNGPYLVLPVFGPSTLRDTAGMPVDMSMDLVRDINSIPERNSAWALRLVDKRADLLQTTTLLEEASLDKYSFIREAYLQHRRWEIYDGNPPDEDNGDDAAPAESAPQ